ncbi:MAG TPA: ABC transporter permease [Synergistaceae bacterium]|mgnify:CR=1 FL=1|nr:ABC transporter permease [Synergistaceae bacterium]
MRRAAAPLAVTALFLLAWEVLCRWRGIPAYLLPAPSRIAAVLVREAPLLARHGLVTGAEILLGIALSLAVAVPLSILMFFSSSMERGLSPLLVASQAIPAFAAAPLLIVWFGYGMGSKVVMAAVIIFFPLAVTLLQGFKSCDPDLVTLFSAMGADFRTTFRLLYWPWALPYFFAGLRVSVSVATIGAVIGEWVGSQKGLGFLMMQGNARLRVDLVFAAIVVLSLVGLGLWHAVSLVERRTVRWRDETRR